MVKRKGYLIIIGNWNVAVGEKLKLDVTGQFENKIKGICGY